MQNEHNTFSSIKNHISFQLEQIIEEAEKMQLSIGEKEYCLLCELAQIRDRFNEIQSTASFFYLKAYIAEFTSQYIEIAKAIQNLSERRHGALIVVERHQNVDHLIQEGIQLNATLSNRLIESIFYPGNPLHDGAVLIKGDYMISAANVLPLSSQDFGQEKVGTRHRAAIGLSEITDALILIVSEETGKMSFALEGTLYPISTPDSNLQ
ncbi:sporulation-specific diadenylate cyclase CdaS [Metabacillus litoralis]|uniref:sporulation-specific diadenylate cyclase CdaS n=1 Tax=Metabacillus TaxID=2675233 RepID=UPI00203A9519|nr:sporulation-specific diadenylate cyclase CdaS [Metabacillus litoralis]MCM3163844.1 sporulation-specific diadenylate cyclase CdaS [Metabacillus litoralis]MCM3410643.1 sporulation-specific diadenylate cyclase CdaS [Metabacillus litoralis]